MSEIRIELDELCYIAEQAETETADQIYALCKKYEHTTDPSWPTATCGECGYLSMYIIDCTNDIAYYCRRCPHIRTNASDPACPAFVRRPKEDKDADTK